MTEALTVRRKKSRSRPPSLSRSARTKQARPDVGAWVDAAGQLREASPDARAVLGLGPELLGGQSLFALTHPLDLVGLEAALQSPGPAWVTFRYRHAALGWVWLEASLSALKAGRKWLLVRDVTSRKRFEEELLVAQKMEAVGRLAGGVAHDFNNLLSVLSSAAVLLVDEVAAGSPAAELAQEIRSGCRRATDLTRQLLAFSGKQMLQPYPVDLREVVDEAAARARQHPGLSVTVEIEAPAAVAGALADHAQLDNIIAILVANARDAMPQGGDVALALRNLTVTPEAALRDGVPPGSWRALSVRDTGRGMDAGVKAHLFEPFFTTKARGKGTGLGLATAWGVLRQFGGHIRVESEPGRGACFTLLLPATEAAEATAPGRSDDAVPARAGQTVLLVEDDASVRWIAAAVLERSGFKVLQAEGGPEALAIAKRRGVVVDLLLTDVVMPGMAGPEVARALLALQPRARVLFMSGYTNDPTLLASIRDASVHFLPKPFDPESLAQRVRDVLAS